MAAAVVAEGLSKRFMVADSGMQSAYMSLLEGITGGRRKHELWALKDVSFDVGEGEFFAVVGPNGSGKSTLIRILSGAYNPTGGRLLFCGPTSPVLPVFSSPLADLTVSENIRVFGAMAGLTGRQVQKAYGEILEFSGVGEFENAPLRTLSSGMMQKLSFAIAVHADSPILLLDEVFNHADEEFLRGFNSMSKGIREDGRTVILVTHNMDLVRRHFDRAVLLEAGTVKSCGSARDVADDYSRLAGEGGD